MTDPTLSSMNQLEPPEKTEASVEAEPSNLKSPTPRQEASWLSAVPVFKTSGLTTPESNSLDTPSSMEPSLCESDLSMKSVLEEPNESPRFEYEFTNLWDGCLYSVYLYDDNDVSACERVVNRPVRADELSYSDTGNGFIVDGEFKYTFKKQPWRPIAAPQPSAEAKLTRRQSIKVRTADDVLASI